MAKGMKTGGLASGVPNKTTAKAKEFISAILNAEEDRIKSALDEIYAEDKKHYLDWIGKNLEYVIPKLARTEIDAEINDPLTNTILDSLSKEELITLAKEAVRNVSSRTET